MTLRWRVEKKRENLFCLLELTSCQAVSFRQVDCRVQVAQEDEATDTSVSHRGVLGHDTLLQVMADEFHGQRHVFNGLGDLGRDMLRC